MTRIYGADPEQLDGVASTMADCADQLDRVRAEVNGALSRTDWRGADADDFSWAWHQQVGPSLTGVGEGLRGTATAARHHAAQQREASGIRDHATGGVPAPGGIRLGPAVGGGDTSGSGWDDFLDGAFLAAGLVGVAHTGAEVIAALAKKGPLTGVLGAVAKHSTTIDGMLPVTVLGKKVPGIGLALTLADVGGTINDFRQNDWQWNQDTVNSAVSAGIGVVALGAGIACPPLGVAIGVAGVLNDVAISLNPNFYNDIGKGVSDAAHAVGGAVGDLADDVGGAISGVARHLPKIF